MSEAAISPAVLDIVEALKHGLVISTISRYFSIAGAVVLVYDILLTLNEEIQLVWSARLSPVKCLYFVVRYGTVLGLVLPIYHMWPFRPPFTDKFCHIVISIGMAIMLISMAAVNWLLIIRVGALFRAKREIMWPLYALFVVSYIAAIGTTIKSSTFSMPTVTFSPEINICVGTRKHVTMVIIYVAPFFLELVTFVLTVYKAVHSVDFVSEPAGPAHLLYVVLRDGLGYYFVMLLLRLWNIYIFGALDINYFYLGVYNMWALVATLVGRMFLNVRDAANLRQWQAESESPQISTFVESRPRDMSLGRRSGYDFVMELPIRSPVNGPSFSPVSPMNDKKAALGTPWN